MPMPKATNAALPTDTVLFFTCIDTGSEYACSLLGLNATYTVPFA